MQKSFLSLFIVFLALLLLREYSLANTTGNFYYFSFIRANPTDPAFQIHFGVDQTRKVAEAVGRLHPEYVLDVELDPMVMEIAILKETLDRLTYVLGPEDTFLLYIHSHGVPLGLRLDYHERGRNSVYPWEDFAEAILRLPARTVIVFVMACHAGHLASAMLRLSHKWEGKRNDQDQNLLVFTSVAENQISHATNFHTAPDAIGNPFTYAVRTALAGAGDGILDGVKDNDTSFEELVQYILLTTREKSRAQFKRPQFVGEYLPHAILWHHGAVQKDVPVPPLP